MGDLKSFIVLELDHVDIVAAQKIEEISGSQPIEIRETSLGELAASNELDASWKYLVPGTCLDCGNEKEFKERFFILTRCPETKEEKEWLDETMNKQYGVENYAVGVFSNDRGLIDSAVCGRCGSRNIVFDP